MKLTDPLPMWVVIPIAVGAMILGLYIAWKHPKLSLWLLGW